MKHPFQIILISLAMLCTLPSMAICGNIQLRYGFSPGQQWACSRMSHMEFMAMGKKHVKRQKDTILYKVSKGKKKGWVHLTAQFKNPPTKTEENKFALGQYYLTFSADFHASGDTRNIQVQGIEKPMADETLSNHEKMALVQTNKMLAESLKPIVFWFPEVSEDAMAPGDEFEEKKTHGSKNDYMATQTNVRKIFVLEEVSEGLAYFSTKQRSSGKMNTMGSAGKTKSAGQGETIFDLKTGMWIEYVSKMKMNLSGGMMGGQGNQDMYITEKRTMQQQ